MKGMQDEMMEIDSVGCSNQTLDFSLISDYSWIEGEKPHPWWQTTDRNELASFVSQKSLNNIENCDLPPPRKNYLGGQSNAYISDEKINTIGFDWEAKSSVFSNLTDQAQGSLDSGFMQGNLRHSHFACDKSPSYTSTIHEDVTEQAFEGDQSIAQLMEALCHSQTRARAAEEVAKQAYAEKEHIFTQFLMQASQLLAYEQWFRLLQLETDNTSQIKNKDQQVSTKFPETLPWILFEGRKLQKRKKLLVNAKKEMLGKLKSDRRTYAVAFALGLSLVGAGLLLGWTVGWMFPRL
uniref:Uncharacterized protein n=2 Tax=Lotus japonicus TaxID=34305 RepID=I3SF48_LOTJA|nr:unknown [Lotus japonicus]